MKINLSRSILVILFDASVAGFSFLFSLYLRLGDDMWQRGELLEIGFFAIIAASLLIMPYMGLNRTIWRYCSLKDLENIAKACSYVMLVFISFMFVYNRLEEMPRAVFFINWLVLMAAVGGARFAYRVIRERKLRINLTTLDDKRIPIILIGADHNAELFIRQLSRDKNLDYVVVAILDDSKKQQGNFLWGVKVYGGTDKIHQVIEELKGRNIEPRKIILSSDLDDKKKIRSLLEVAEKYAMTMARLPKLSSFDSNLDGKISIKPIVLEDLLGRPQKSLDRDSMSKLIKGKRVLVTGAGGTIGSELTRQIAAFEPSRLIMIENSEFNLYHIDQELEDGFPKISKEPYIADIRNKGLIDSIFAKEKPELVFHAAALKHVPLVENNIISGVTTNVFGTKSIADHAVKHKVKMMVLISTDKAVNPLNIMGATKRAAETYINSLAESELNLDTKFITVRFGNVIGSSGSVIPLFEKQLKKGGPITVTHPDMVRYFMTVREAVELVLQASVFGDKLEDSKSSIYVLDMGEPVRILDLATQMIRMAGLKLDKDINIEFTGLRDGEKLFEELFYLAESPSKTEHESIMLAKPKSIDLDKLQEKIDSLFKYCSEHSEEKKIVESLKNLVPEYKS